MSFLALTNADEISSDWREINESAAAKNMHIVVARFIGFLGRRCIVSAADLCSWPLDVALVHRWPLSA